LSDLADHLKELISAEGPISVARYMAEALTHPEFGYYMRGDPLGRAGDFITAPEISQMFGELIGAWCAGVWHATGAPDPVRLVELGPGRGTLMADALRAVRGDPAFAAAIRVDLVETSPALRARQAETLANVTPPPAWYNSFAEVPDRPLLVIANEFFDALPIHQFVMTAAGWRERLVGVDDGAFSFRVADEETAALSAIPPVGGAPSAGALVEACPDGLRLVRALAERIAGHGGAALIVDYGHAESAVGETLQAVKGHEYADVLTAPGTADLTAHVDFAALGRAAAAAGAAVYGPRAQGDFLRALGIEVRAAKLAEGKSPAQADAVHGALNRLINGDEMGTLFKVLAIANASAPAPPGF
jgi:NADH dehydrogenase [ubiquinone] 1 alpha subcomplex assembly factor 7